jgi:hypothetical protein
VPAQWAGGTACQAGNSPEGRSKEKNTARSTDSSGNWLVKEKWKGLEKKQCGNARRQSK